MTIIVRPTERNVTVQTRPRQVSVAAVLIGLVEPVGVTSVPTVWGLPASAV